MPVLFTNNASATIASSITPSATSIVVSTGQGVEFPTLTGSDYFIATLTDSSNNLEIVKVTARSGDTLTVVRAQEGTTARTYTAGSLIELRITATVLSSFIQTGTAVSGTTGTFSGAVSGTTGTFSDDGSFTGTGQVKLPAGTTGQRSGSPISGMIRYNTSYSQFEGYTGSAWGSIGGGATGGGSDQVFVQNGQNVTTNYTIPAGKNASSVGPISLNSGVVVTVGSGSRWVVL